MATEPVLSLSMIVRDEQETLARALEDAAQFCDELVIVDTGSVDRTVEIAESFGARVFHFDWIDDFAAACNYALDQCLGQWIMWFDADDRIPEQAWPGFRTILDELPKLVDIDVVMLAYHYEFSSVYPDVCIDLFPCVRLFRNVSHLRWQGRIHEYIQYRPSRTMRRTNAWIDHRPVTNRHESKSQRNLQIIEQCVAEGDRSPRMLHHYGATLASLGRHREALALLEEALSVSDPNELSPEYIAGRYATVCLMAACAALDLEEQQLGYLVRATVLDSERVEAFIELGKHFYDKHEWRRAIPFFTAATKIRAPINGHFNPANYSCLPWDYLATCSAEIAEYNDALDYTMLALPGHPEKERLVKNMRVYAEHL